MGARWLVPWFAVMGAACNPPPDTTDGTDDTDSDTEGVHTDDTDDTDAGPSVDVVASGVRSCAEPALRDEAFFDLVEARLPTQPSVPEFRLRGGGVAIADITGDGILDILVAGHVDLQMHIGQPDGTYVEEAAERLPRTELFDASMISPADIDGDGDLDLLVLRFQRTNVLLRNDGTGRFTDTTPLAGTTFTGVDRSQTASWGDVDGDGDLDLFIGNYGPRPEEGQSEDPNDYEPADPSQFLENTGDFTFLDRSDEIPQVLHDAYTFMSGWYDLDLDGDQDLVVVNDFGWARPSRIFWNRDGVLEMDKDSANGGAGFDISFAGMGLGVGDLNGDQRPDFLQSSWRELSLLVSNGGLWFEEAPDRGVVHNDDGPVRQVFGWGAVLADVDNDGDEDGLVNWGYWDEYVRQIDQADALFLQDDEGNFSDQAPAWGLDDPSPTRGLVAVDLNDDGMLDIVKRRLNGKTPMYRSRCGANAWLRVRPRMQGPNSHAVGTRVHVVDGERRWTRWVTAGGTSMYSSEPAEVHVGLGDRDTVERVEITWPHGEVTVLEDVDTRQILDLTYRP